MLKPDVSRRGLTAEITNMFTAAGYNIELFDVQKVVDTDKIFRHYGQLVESLGQPFMDKVQKAFVGNQVVPMIISSESPEIIANVRKFLGATDPSKADKDTVRGKYGIDSFEKANAEMRFCENLVHASDSIESFKAETGIWFSENVLKLIK